MFVAWGPELGFLYNDSYAEILGEKHPHALGARFYDIWSEIWTDIEPMIQHAMAGEATYHENLPLTMHRNGYDELTWFTFSYSPVRDEHGKVAGMYCACTETTAAVLAEKAVQEEMQRLHQLFEQAPGFMAVVRGREHTYELVNRAYIDLIGQRDIVGRPIRDALPELAGQGFFELLDDVYLSGKPFVGHRVPVRFQWTQGAAMEERLVNFVFQPITGTNRQITGIFIQGHDVTEQYRAEERWRDAALQAEHARDRLTALLNAAPVGMFMVDARGNFLEVNPTHQKIWGYASSSTAHINDHGEWKGWWADNSERHGQPIQDQEWAMARALRGEDAIQDVLEIEPFDQPGIRRVILNSGAPIRDALGKLIGAVVAQMDITDQVKAEAALRESEAKFRTITDAMPQMVWSSTADGYNDYCNKQWFSFTGTTEEQMLGRGWLKLIHPDDQQMLSEAWQESLLTGAPYQTEHRFRHVSGEYRWVLARGLPVRNHAGRIVRWMGTLTDIHDQRLGAEELRAANQRKDDFLAMLAHELRNPLAPISTAAYLLKIAGGDEHRVQQASSIIVRQVKHMTDLVNDLLDVSRVTRGLVVLDKTPVDIKSVVNGAIEQALPIIDARRHELHTRLGADNAMVSGDRTRLVQVLANLLTNAAKYTPQGGNIEIGLDVHETEAKVCVSDNGTGIDPSLLPHIFDLFIQGERTPDRSQGGLGLGLALVKSLLALHGGRVEAKSDGLGKGSTFTIYLPILAKDAMSERRERPREALTKVVKRLRLMIVDDNLDAADSLASLLQAQGHQVTVREDANSALREAAVHPPQVFILDIGLPDMDGYELARQLRARPETRNAVFVALTGYGQAHDKALAKAAGFHHHFVKPMDIEHLAVVLSQIA